MIVKEGKEVKEEEERKEPRKDMEISIAIVMKRHATNTIIITFTIIITTRSLPPSPQTHLLTRSP